MHQWSCDRIRPSDRERLNQGMMKTVTFAENFKKGRREHLVSFWKVERRPEGLYQLLQATESSSGSFRVDSYQGGGLFLPELNELAQSRSHSESQFGGIPILMSQQVQRFRQHRWKIGMLHVDFNPSAPEPGLPQCTGSIFGRAVGADTHCQCSAHPPGGHLKVLGLAPAFAGLSFETGRAMRQNDRRLDFVAVLAPWTRPTSVNHIALFEQFGNREFGRVHGSLSLHAVSAAIPLVASEAPLRLRRRQGGAPARVQSRGASAREPREPAPATGK